MKKGNRELELLIEISSLLKKYGVDTFSGLAKYLSSPENIESVIDLLIQSGNVYKKAQKKGFKEELNTRIFIDRLKLEYPEKYRILDQLIQDLENKVLLPKLIYLQEFGTELGISKTKLKSIKSSISEIIVYLSKLPVNELRAQIKEIEKIKDSDRSLHGWSEIILKNNKTEEEEK